MADGQSRYPSLGTPIFEYATSASFPASSYNGALALALDTDDLYVYSTGSSNWVIIGGPGGGISIGALDAAAATATGLNLASSVLSTQSADATHPGMVNNTTQTFSGAKTFTGAISASNLSGTNTGDLTLGTPNGLSLSSQALSLGLSSTSTTGALSSTDWNTFNSKGSGSVTSVAMTVPTFLSISGSPITTSGTLAVTLSGTALPVVNGGTGLTSGTSGGVLAYTASGTLASSGALTASQLVIGGGDGAVPSVLAAGTQYQSLTMGASAPGYSAVNLAQAAAVTGVLPNANTTAVSTNTASTIVVRDGSGNFSAGTITATLTGTASGNIAKSLMTTLGDIIYEDVTPTPARLAGNTTTTKKYLSQTGNGSISAAPSWAQVAFSDLSGSATGAQLPNPSSSTLGGVQSAAAVSHQWINSISTSGVPALSQPAFTDISGSVASTQMPALTGDVTTSAGAVATTVAKIAGTTVSGTTGSTNVVFSASPTLSGTVAGALTWSGAQTFAPTSADAITVTGNGGKCVVANAASDQYGMAITGNSVATHSFGMLISAGAGSASDVPLYVRNQAATVDLLKIKGDGSVVVGDTSTTLGLLLNNNTASYSPSSFNYYEEYSATMTSATNSGIFTSNTISVTGKITRVGRLVTLLMPTGNATLQTATYSFTFGTSTIPARFRPAQAMQYVSLNMRNNNSVNNAGTDISPGYLQVLTDGSLTFKRTFTEVNFTTGTCGFEAFAVSWTV